jgi:hypothetical protein
MCRAFLFCLFLWSAFAFAEPRKLPTKPGDCLAIALKLFEVGRTRPEYLSNLRDIEGVDSYGIKRSDPRYELRRKLVAAARNPEMRDLLREAAYGDLYRTSERILDRVQEAKANGKIDEAAQVYDVLSFGAGPHDLVTIAAIRNANPDLKIATLEASDRVASVFDKEGFELNSLNREGKEDQVPEPGVGNQNALPGGIIQVPDLTARAYPVAKRLADTVLFNRAALAGNREAPIVFGTAVEKVEDLYLSGVEGEKWPARYRITTNQGVFYAQAIFNNTGLSRELNLERLSPLARSRVIEARNDTSKGIPKVQSVPDYFDSIDKDPRSFGTYSEGVTAVIGQGDSSNIFFEHILGLGPELSYGSANAQDGRPQNLVWIGQDKTTCEKFLQGVRNRYSDIAGGIKSGIIKPYEQKLVDFERLANGKIKLTIANEGGPGKKTKKRTLIVDRVVFGTGYLDQSSLIYEPIITSEKSKVAQEDSGNGFRESKYLEPINGKISGLGDTAIGKRLVGAGDKKVPPQEIYFNGPAAGKLARKKELRNVSENVVSLFNTTRRTEANAKKLAKNLEAQGYAKVPGEGSLSIAESDVVRKGTDTEYVFTEPENVRGISRFFGLKDMSLTNLVLGSLSNVKSSGGGDLTISFRRVGSKGNRFVFSTQPPLRAEVTEELAKRLYANPGVWKKLEENIGKDSANDSVSITLPFFLAKKGKSTSIDLERASLNFLNSSASEPQDKKRVELTPKVRVTPKDPRAPNQVQKAIALLEKKDQKGFLSEVAKISEPTRAELTEVLKALDAVKALPENLEEAVLDWASPFLVKLGALEVAKTLGSVFGEDLSQIEKLFKKLLIPLSKSDPKGLEKVSPETLGDNLIDVIADILEFSDLKENDRVVQTQIFNKPGSLADAIAKTSRSPGGPLSIEEISALFDFYERTDFIGPEDYDAVNRALRKVPDLKFAKVLPLLRNVYLGRRVDYPLESLAQGTAPTIADLKSPAFKEIFREDPADDARLATAVLDKLFSSKLATTKVVGLLEEAFPSGKERENLNNLVEKYYVFDYPASDLAVFSKLLPQKRRISFMVKQLDDLGINTAKDAREIVNVVTEGKFNSYELGLNALYALRQYGGFASRTVLNTGELEKFVKSLPADSASRKGAEKALFLSDR